MVQPKAEMDLQFESTKLSTTWGYVSAIALCVTTFGTIALMSGFFLKPDATFDDYVSDVVPLFGSFFSISGVSKIATRLTAARYCVKLSPSFLVPSNWTGCLGVMNNYDSLLPNKKALFDIPVARSASAYLTSLALAIAAFVVDGSFNGGDNALCIRLQFFYNNPLLSFIQFVIRPYTDDLGNVLPYAVEGVGVPVDPLAFAGLLVFPEVAEQIYAITGANIAIGAPDQSLPLKLLDKLAEPKKCSITLKAYMYNYTGIARYKFNVNFITNESALQALASPSATPNKKEKLHATSPSKQATKQSSGKKPKLN